MIVRDFNVGVGNVSILHVIERVHFKKEINNHNVLNGICSCKDAIIFS